MKKLFVVFSFLLIFSSANAIFQQYDYSEKLNRTQVQNALIGTAICAALSFPISEVLGYPSVGNILLAIATNNIYRKLLGPLFLSLHTPKLGVDIANWFLCFFMLWHPLYMREKGLIPKAFDLVTSAIKN